MTRRIPFFLASAATALALAATGANALAVVDTTTTIPYSFQGDHLTSGYHGVDFVGDAADLSQPDGSEDLWFNAGSDTASINSTFIDSQSYGTVHQIGGFARDSVTGDALMYSAGDVVEQVTGVTFSSTPLDVAAALPTSGDTGIFGFVIDFLSYAYIGDVNDFDYFEGFCIELSGNDARCEQTIQETYYGWVQLTRGSIIPGTLAYNPTSGAGATVFGSTPAVPLPAAGWLMVAGLGGLGALRRRKG